MFEVHRKGPNRIDVEFGGKLDSDDMRGAIRELVSASKGIEHGCILFQIGDYRVPTLGGIAVEFAHFFELLQMIRRFDRAAVIADQRWIRTISEIEGKLFPGLEIKGFAPGDAEAAGKWLEA